MSPNLSSVKTITACRICGGVDLKPVISLGSQALTGIFPRTQDQKISSGPLELVRCNDEKNKAACGLLQLNHSYDLDELYGENYGYRSSLNRSMLNHLNEIVKTIENLVILKKDDYILDIGSNDGSLLSFYPEEKGLNLVGIDPTGIKFKDYYQQRISLIPTFFSASELCKHLGSKKMKVITSISMFYDLESPLQFMREVFDVLADDGVWFLEQSYMPTMLSTTSYDTICHEHLEYYGLKQIKWMADLIGLKIISMSLNDTNGGSFLLGLAKNTSSLSEAGLDIKNLLMKESTIGLKTEKPYFEFTQRVKEHKEKLITFFNSIEQKGQKILGYGASTKGNVILQYCGISRQQLPYIAEINQDKFGCFTPGTLIPIISEKEARLKSPEYFFVLPWHFRKGIIEKEQYFLRNGGKLIFPLPEIEIVPVNSNVG
ncbi:MAG TPA: methyltransferase [Anaerolineaceae bacterium]|nr:methyltransferase [Anaerolineaceae bacterium]